MYTIAVSEIADGMVLSEAVYGNSGQIILKEGTALTKSLGQRLAARGIQQVAIAGTIETPSEKVTPGANEEIIEEENSGNSVELIFSKSLTNPIMHSIFKYLSTYIQSKGGAHD